MKIAVIIAAVLIIVGMGAVIFFNQPRVNEKLYAGFKEPQIIEMPKQKMLVVESKGDPNVAGKKTFSKLFKTFFKIKGTKMAAPRARWPKDLSVPKEQWIGLFALPLPENIASLSVNDPDVRIEDWEYGKVAQILYTGPYSDETPTIEKLKKFISDNGYKITGYHEEEYLRGPGMFFAANPSKYLTLIRYRVEK